MQNLIEGLNDKQKEAVLATEGPCLVIAGAGSGKTKVLTHKIAYLISEKGVKPYNILAITFTNKAAREMKQRVEKLVGDVAQEMWMGTFHSICVRILRRFIDRIGFDTSFLIFDTSDQKTVVKECLKALNIDDKTFSDRSVLSEISNDMSQFKSHHRLSSWAGLTPGCDESAGKKKSVKMSRAGVYLKPCLVEVAHGAVKDKINTYYANKFNKISKRRGKKRAYIAIARKILVAIYHMLSTGEAWNPRDLASSETSDKDRIKFTKNNFNQSLKQLLSLGLTSNELINMINQNAKLDN